ncbi:hypothetical protein Pst134EA_021291 [Puccinia striiformis f. sp. tritici]|uniref:hypothetical protein n=1 Tax=Puccinia striiformis f. sp. tritici TaxID=168172 RepID=UPI00200878BA|nr:hypothetical protein Pst134EA_021291 [Puccinia striiformis f. sp. tritici]KAH9457414.1 hypothetical protein Pst134EA_021291 [Puccinia striiformis f. sp. tritici]KAI9617704.1 hypothetical protein H4Q26_013010 [Puccinia striiformis f. sp. tritici PST-130]
MLGFSSGGDWRTEFVPRPDRALMPAGIRLGTHHVVVRSLARNHEVIMADSIEESLHRLNLDPSEIHQHWPQGDLVREGFNRLAIKCDIRNDTRADSLSTTPPAVSLNPVNYKKAFLNQLETDLLPLLRSLLEHFSFLLDPFVLQVLPGPALKLILQTQSALKVTLNNSKSMFYTLCPERVGRICKQTDDQHDEELKIFRLSGLDSLLTDILTDLCSVCTASSELIWQLGLSTETCNQPEDLTDTRARLTREICRSKIHINWTIRWLKGSELELVQQDWTNQFDEIDVVLNDITKRANLASNNEQNDQSLGADEWTDPNPPSQLALQIAQSLIPVIKLTRLFFKKSYEWARSKKFPLFTKMSSDQHQDIAGSASHCAGYLIDFHLTLVFDPDPVDLSSMDFAKSAKMIQASLQTVLFLFVLHFIPDEFPAQDNFKEWLIDWFTTFNLAMHNFIKKLESLATNVPQ